MLVDQASAKTLVLKYDLPHSSSLSNMSDYPYIHTHTPPRRTECWPEGLGNREEKGVTSTHQ